MKKKKREKVKPTSPQSFMLMSEDAKLINTYGSIGPAGQQLFLHKLAQSTEERTRHTIEELTK